MEWQCPLEHGGEAGGSRSHPQLRNTFEAMVYLSSCLKECSLDCCYVGHYLCSGETLTFRTWLYTPATPGPGSQGQEDCRVFEGSLG